MDEKKKEPAEMVDGWLDEILSKHELSESSRQLGADESAVASARLIHPDDMELERIVQETLAQDWGEHFAESTVSEHSEAESTQFFNPVRQEPAAEQPVADMIPPEPVEEDEPVTENDAPQKTTFGHKVLRFLRSGIKKGDGLFGIPHIAATAIWLCLIVAIGIPMGRTLWLCAADLLALGKEGQEITLTVDEQDGISEIAQKLQKAGMIEYPNLFEIFAKLTGKGDKILTGTITFNKSMVYDYNALINALSYRGNARVTIDVTIPEGYNCAQIFALLEKKGVCTVAELEEYAANGNLEEYWFLKDIKRGHKYCLEGFLFPDTYEFYVNDKPEHVIHKFLDDFDYRFTDRLMDKFEALKKKTGLNFTIRQLITLASMVEKEKANDLEGYSIASVFYNRLTHSASYPYLNSDATILYATDYYNKGELITNEQINASPYNTYTQKGLPAGPIANPGLSSIDAALDPDSTKYYYFIFDKSAGVHRFSKTLAEHNAWADKLGLN